MANTLPSALVPDTASDMAITILQDRLASLDCFSTDFSQDLVDPTRPNSIAVVTGAAASVENPTNFETGGDSVVTSVKVSPTHISQIFHITQAELNSGHKLERLLKVNLHTFANAILDKVLAPLTVANYGAAHVAATPADLDVDDLKTLWGEASNFTEKNAILDGTYYANFLSGNRDEYSPQDGVYGFDKFRMNNRFDGAGAGVVGAIVDPQAMAIAAAVPAVSPEVAAQMSSMELIELPDLGLTVQFCKWASTASRTTWCSFDVCIGSIAADTTAAKLIATA